MVTATDRTGNSENDNIENLFIDTKAPTIEFSTIAGKTWDENGELINDNTPEFKVTVTDPGYPTSGLGVARENLKVYLDNNDNVADTLPAFGGLLENKAAWVVADGIFENVIDNLAENLGRGLVSGTYWINVVASDNLGHAGSDNVIAKRSFTIDLTAPTVSLPTAAVNPLDGTTITSPLVQTTSSLLIRGTGLTTEVGATITIYIMDATTGVTAATENTLVQSDGAWSKLITLPVAGTKYQIEITCTDLASNESLKVLYGYVLADGTMPTVTITSPVTDTSTDATSALVTGSVTKDTWEEFTDLTVAIQVGSATPGSVTLDANGNFSISASLTEGANTITITATDQAGNISSASVMVTRTVTPWATYAIIIVIVALVLAAIAIFRKR